MANIADLYFKTSLKARLSIVYVETWEDQDQVGQNDQNDENDQNDQKRNENAKQPRLSFEYGRQLLVQLIRMMMRLMRMTMAYKET